LLDMRTKLSTFWLFATLNYVYADVVTIYDKGGNLGYSQTFLLGASILVEIPMAMVLLSRILKYRANRWVNIIAGAAMTVIQAATLFVAIPTAYYVFFSVIEVATTLVVVWSAWKWPAPSSPE
jgi:uncharacterized protein DUF6326